MKKPILSIIFAVIVFTANAQQSFYVDGTNGNDANNGTSLATAWKTIQQSFNSATPGSVVYIKGGTYKSQLSVNVSGTTDHPIEFRNYQNDSVYIDGTGLTANPMIDIEDDSNLIFRNLVIQNLVINNAVGIQIVCNAGGKVKNIVFKNLIIRNISWTSNPATKPSSSKNSQPFIAYGEGITAANVMSNIIVDSCQLYNNISGFSESLSFGGYIDGVTVTNNKVHDNTNIGIDFTGNYTDENPVPALDQVRNVICRGNLCYNNVSNYATSGGIYVDGARDILIERNISYHNGYGIELGCEENGSASNITVRDNLFYDNQEAGMAIGGYTTSTTGQVLNCTITNNTFVANNYANDGSGEIDMTKASNCTFKNNIFYTNAQNLLVTIENIAPQAGNVFDYNCWYTPNNDSTDINVNWKNTSYSTFQQYKSGSGFDAHSFFKNPLLVNASIASPDFHLQNTSPCINAGDPAYVVAIGETDVAGDFRRVGNIDIGAYENPNLFYASGETCAGTGVSFTTSLIGNSYQWQKNSGSGFVNIGTDPSFAGVNTNTLNISGAGVVTSNYGMQFRASVDGTYSDVYTLKFVDYWIGTVSNAWENPQNWSCGSLPDGNTDVIINTGSVILNSVQSVRSISVSKSAAFNANSSGVLHVMH